MGRLNILNYQVVFFRKNALSLSTGNFVVLLVKCIYVGWVIIENWRVLDSCSVLVAHRWLQDVSEVLNQRCDWLGPVMLVVH